MGWCGRSSEANGMSDQHQPSRPEPQFGRFAFRFGPQGLAWGTMPNTVDDPSLALGISTLCWATDPIKVRCRSREEAVRHVGKLLNGGKSRQAGSVRSPPPGDIERVCFWGRAVEGPLSGATPMGTIDPLLTLAAALR
jgi:hypothetical protein